MTASERRAQAEGWKCDARGVGGMWTHPALGVIEQVDRGRWEWWEYRETPPSVRMTVCPTLTDALEAAAGREPPQ